MPHFYDIKNPTLDDLAEYQKTGRVSKKPFWKIKNPTLEDLDENLKQNERRVGRQKDFAANRKKLQDMKNERTRKMQREQFEANKAKLEKQRLSRIAQRPPASHRVAKVLPKAKPVIWRSADHPMPGTIYRLPDDMTLQRGITYTFLPDGRSIRVPAMNRLDVRAAAQGHQEGEDGDIMQALQQILTGKRGKASFDGQGRAQGPAAPAPVGRRRGPAARRDVRGEGMRGMPVEA